MEMVLYMMFSERTFLPWDRLLRVGLIFLLSGALLFGVQRYMKNTEEGSETSAAKAADSGSREWVRKENEAEIGGRAMSTDKVLPEENTGETGFLPVISKDVVEAKSSENPENKQMPCPADAEAPLTAAVTVTDSEERMVPLTGDINMKIKAPVAGETGITPDGSGNSEAEPDVPVISESDTNTEDLERIGNGSADDLGSDAEKDVNGMRVISGFHLDPGGYITGTDSNIDVTDAVLIIPAVLECAGVRDGALSGLGESVFEIYIPANIRDIGPGAFAGLTSLMFVEVAEDNPGYCSIDGVLYSREGEEIFNPYRRNE